MTGIRCPLDCGWTGDEVWWHLHEQHLVDDFLAVIERLREELTFRAVSEVNRTRCERWHPGFPADGWTGADWSNAMAGEAGEVCNVVKKLRRTDFGIVQAAADTIDDLKAKLATEIGDTFLYLDLLAQFYGLDIARCIADTFNRVSVREGFPERIAVDAYGARNEEVILRWLDDPQDGAS